MTPAPKIDELRTLDEFMAQALAMEREAVGRYTEFADTMEMHNNREVAALFRTMAQYEDKHAAQIMAQMGWTSDPPPPPGGFSWIDLEAPETVPGDQVHYLMRPWHALQLALAAEERAVAFFGQIANVASSESVRRAAIDMQQEEREHVELINVWLKRYPQPDADWANDPDPPRYTD